MSFLSLGVPLLIPSKEQHIKTKRWPRLFFLLIVFGTIDDKDINTLTETHLSEQGIL